MTASAPPSLRAVPAGGRRPAASAVLGRRHAAAPRRPPASVWRAGHPRRRVRALQVGVVALFVVAMARVAYTQAVDPDGYSAQGLRQRLDAEVVPARRGSILDRTSTPLALSIAQQTIYADPALVTDPVGTAQRLAAVLDAVPGRVPLDVTDLATRLSDRANRFTYVARQVDDSTAEQVAGLALPGVQRREEARRFQPSGPVAASIIGTTDIDGNGTAGIEQLWDSVLRGTAGEVVRERAPRDRTFPNGRYEETPSVPGRDVVLTIDSTMQYETEQILLRAVDEAGAKGGMVVIMDPATGDVLAMANVDRQDRRVRLATANKAMVDVFEPGSVNKMITMAGAVQEGVTTPDTTWAVPPVLMYDDHEFHDSHADADGEMTARDILTESSNIGTFKIAERLGNQRLYDYLAAFGLADRTPIAFPGESAGLLRPPGEWQGTDKVTIPYGQGVAVTALQVLGAYNAIANGGVYVPPRLVEAVVDADGTRHDAPAPATREVVSPATAGVITSMLTDVVSADRGTGKQAAIPGYTVAGKTGTAKKPQGPNGYYDAHGDPHYMQVFAGFAPADHPRFAAIVVLDEAQKATDGADPIFGGAVAAPVFRELGRMALRELQVPPTTGIDSRAQPAAGDAVAQGVAQAVTGTAGTAGTAGTTGATTGAAATTDATTGAPSGAAATTGATIPLTARSDRAALPAASP